MDYKIDSTDIKAGKMKETQKDNLITFSGIDIEDTI